MFRSFLDKFLVNPFYGFLIVAASGFLFYYFFTQVDLQPQVKPDFFFKKTSKIYQNDRLIHKKFILQDTLVLSLPTKDVKNLNYLNMVKRLSEHLEEVPGIKKVQSLTNGPEDLYSALTHPMWMRFLDTNASNNSLIVCFVDLTKVKSIIKKVKAIRWSKEFRQNRIYISGIPFIIDEIRRMLSRDMKQFLVATVAVSSVVLLIIFLSLVVTLGANITALTAAALTLAVQQNVGIPVGILTANLGAIVYVLTISHIVFLTSNWRQGPEPDRRKRLIATIAKTLPASFWAMATTVFGFVSLIFVEAKPLQQLGVGGTIGTLAAFLVAYLLYPIFLRFSWAPDPHSKNFKVPFFLPFHPVLGIPVAVAILVGAVWLGNVGIEKLNTDPSLLTYFKKNQSIYSGIKALDRYGGSNPLNFVVSRKNGEKLKTTDSYHRMMALQEDLEKHPAVGNVLSLPILMKETQTSWIARMLPWGSVLSILSKDQYGKIARGFVTEDFTQGLYLIRMRESGRSTNRSKIINQLMAKPRKYGLRLDLVGGSYYMQSALSTKIQESMKQGITALLILFSIIILLVSFSVPITLFATATIAGATAIFLGTVGFMNIPVDIISSPSVNIILGLAVDGMIHIILAARRLSEAKGHRTDRDGWIKAVKSQGPGVLISGLVVASGFSVFYLSGFPPSQRFGLEIVFGSVVAMLMTLLVMPHLCLMFRKKKQT